MVKQMDGKTITIRSMESFAEEHGIDALTPELAKELLEWRETERLHNKKLEPWWFDRKEIAAVIGCHPNSVSRFVKRDQMPDKDPETKCWDVREVCQYWKDKALNPKEDEPVDDIELEGNSPALERYRTARAELTEIELAKEQGKVINRELATSTAVEVFGMLKSGLETLQRHCAGTCGQSVAGMVEQIVEDVAGELRSRIQ